MVSYFYIGEKYILKNSYTVERQAHIIILKEFWKKNLTIHKCYTIEQYRYKEIFHFSPIKHTI